ncbi:glycosyltransferase family 4 protein [Methylolobus aquaticus]
MRILVISHAHPAFSFGGGENVAYGLFQELKERPECEAFFLAHRSDPIESRGSRTFFDYPDHANETLFTSEHFDYFHFSVIGLEQTRDVLGAFRLFLKRTQPDVVHFQHYILIGLELIREVRNYSSEVAIVLTLHEYLAICCNYGQMVTTNGQELCWQASPSACANCFPGKRTEEFILRELYIKSFLALVDKFICPSRFLFDRYVDWGLDPSRMIFLENGQPPIAPTTTFVPTLQKVRNRFAYFGQINLFKGVTVLLEAMLLSQGLSGESLCLSIYGSGLEKQPATFQRRFRQLLAEIGTAAGFYGAYQREALSSIMQDVDWVVVPSIWWENSPLVIQEAFSHGKPVICSDIGGMAEKVRPYETGLHFRVGDPKDLAGRLIEAATTQRLWESLSARIVPPPTIKEICQAHVAVYENCCRERRLSAVP